MKILCSFILWILVGLLGCTRTFCQGDKLVVRIRTPSGSLKRVEVFGTSTLKDLRSQLEAEGLVNSPKDKLLKGEHPIENETKTVDELGMKNGDILDLQSAEPRAPPSSSSGGGGAPPRTASDSSGSTAGAASSASFQERLKKRREANAGIAADKPRFDPFPELARSRNVENAGSKGLSLHDIESEENSKFNIKQQEKPHISKVSLGLQCAEAFSAFAAGGGGAAGGGDPMRCGLLLGRYLNGSRQVRVEAIYEPPQHPRPTAVEYDPQDLALAKPGCREAAEVAAALGMEPVGWVFSCPPRAYELSALDVFTGARLQCEAMGDRALGRERGRAWAMVAAKMTESGEISFEAFQVSDLAVQMSAEGVLIDNDNIAQMVDKIRTTENVIAENRNTREVDCLWFTVPVPIASHPSKLAARFPPAHRKGGRAVQRRDLRRAVFGAGGGGGAEETLESRLSDFHLLMALHNRFENKEDFTKLCQHLSVKKKNHMKLSSKYQIMLEMICGGSH